MNTKRKKRKHWWRNVRFKYRLTLTNENTLEDVDERVKGGMNVSGDIVVDTAENALLIPTQALGKDQEGYYVTLMDGQTRRVEMGVMTDDRVQILSGLSAGEYVVY